MLLLQNVIVKNGIKTLPSQIHYQPGLQQSHNYDFELCFKVSDDFSNVVAAWNAAMSIAKDIIAEYGRCVNLQSSNNSDVWLAQQLQILTLYAQVTWMWSMPSAHVLMCVGCAAMH